jgi:hypothetical protein
MSREFWQKQTDKPLFEDLVWSRPQQKNAAGKLLVIGGNLHAFAAPAEAYTEAEKAGAGTVRVILPDAAKKIVGKIMLHVEYAPSTPSGSFATNALAELLDFSAWADGVLIAGDLGRNSETAMLLENFLQKFNGQVTLTKDAVDYIVTTPEVVAKRKDTLLIMSFAQLQKIATKLGFKKPFTFDMDLLRMVDTLHEFTTEYALKIIVLHKEQLLAAVQGQIVSTIYPGDQEIWRVKTASHAAVWWLQNPSKPLEAFATSLVRSS